MRIDRTGALLLDGLSPRGPSIESALPVLMYHSVSDDPEPGVHPYYRIATSPARFAQQMQWLAEHSYTALSLDTALDARFGSRTFERSVVVTFDDGYVDFLEHAWPLIESHGFSATVFLPTAYIGDARCRFKGKECLTWSEVRDLSKRGVTFGSHTVSHPVITQLPWQDVCTELRQSREEIETRLGAPVTSFAYPFAFPQEDGDFVSRFCRQLRLENYTAAVTTVVGRFGASDDPLCMKRLPVNEGDDIPLFRAKLAGAYDWVGDVQSAWKRTRAAWTR